jgi:hypothetical protein
VSRDDVAGTCLLVGMFRLVLSRALLVISTVIWTCFEATASARAGPPAGARRAAGAAASAALVWLSGPHFHRLTTLAAETPTADAFWNATARALLA